MYLIIIKFSRNFTFISVSRNVVKEFVLVYLKKPVKMKYAVLLK